jgi:hypothetical protein
MSTRNASTRKICRVNSHQSCILTGGGIVVENSKRPDRRPTYPPGYVPRQRRTARRSKKQEGARARQSRVELSSRRAR